MDSDGIWYSAENCLGLNEVGDTDLKHRIYYHQGYITCGGPDGSDIQ